MGKRFIRNSKLNKLDTNICNKYLNSDLFNIRSVYDKCSKEKYDAFNTIQNDMEDLYDSGYIVKGLKIISHNTYNYSAGFLYANPYDTKVYLRYYTAKHTRDIYIGDLL